MLLHDWYCYSLLTKEKSPVLNIGEYIAQWLFKIGGKTIFHVGDVIIYTIHYSNANLWEKKKAIFSEEKRKSSNQHLNVLS